MKKERYFLVYAIGIYNHGQATEQCSLSMKTNGSYPSEQWLKSAAKKDGRFNSTLDNILIHSVNELSESDFEDYHLVEIEKTQHSPVKK